MSNSANPCEVFVQGLSLETLPPALGKAMGQFGEVATARVIIKKEGQEMRSRGFGFVLYKEQEAAAKAVAANTVEIEGKQCKIYRARARRQIVNAYLGKLSDQITRDDLMEFFKANNPISATVKRKENNGQVSCYGFVRFPTNEALMEAIRNNREIEIKGVKILVRTARSLPYSIRNRGRGYRYRGGFRRQRGRGSRAPRGNMH